MSNRMPVLDILREHFPDWQIILLTYDKIWYEIVRMQTDASRDWLYHELYLGTVPEGSTCQCTAAMERVGPTSWHERVSTLLHMMNAPRRSMLVRRSRVNSSGIAKIKEFRCAITPTRAE